MELNPLIPAIIGGFIGGSIQFYFNRRLKIHELDIKARSELYLQLFTKLRDLNNDTIYIHSLICDAQIYASDSVIDILHKLEPGKPFNEKLLYDLLVAIRKEIRPKSDSRNLKIFVHNSSTDKNSS